MTDDQTAWERLANLTPSKSRREGDSISLYLDFKTLANLEVFSQRSGIQARSSCAIALIETAVQSMLDNLDDAEAHELREQIEVARLRHQERVQARVAGEAL